MDASRAEAWDIVLPRTLEFQGRQFMRSDICRSANTVVAYCHYYCGDFFKRRQMPGLYVKVHLHPDEAPDDIEVVTAKLESTMNSLAELARREHERTEMLALDDVVNGGEE